MKHWYWQEIQALTGVTGNRAAMQQGTQNKPAIFVGSRLVWYIASMWCAFFATLNSACEADHPNIVYILVDELAYFETGFMGARDLHTPNMDRLAAGGVIMRNILSGGSNCAPARCTLLTGRHTGHTSVRGNSGDNAIRADERTIAEVLKPLGYATGGYGKWGVGGRDSTGVPEKHGFDEFFGYYDQVHAHTYYPPYLLRNSEEVALPGNHGGTRGETYSQYVIHEAAMGFIRQHGGKQPFFAYLPYTPPHGPFAIPVEDPAYQYYAAKNLPREARLFAAMTTMVDRQIGEVLDLLAELGIEEDTLVFFSGDNGSQDRFADQSHPRGLFSGNKDPHSSLEFRGTKGSCYEGAFRVPFAVTWKGRIAPGRVSEHLGYFPDILPTIAEAAGAAVPPGIDGISFLPELLGSSGGREQEQHQFLYFETERGRALRQEKWRIVKAPKGNGWELYNLQADPSESNDLAAADPDRLARLVSLAEQAHQPISAGTYTTRERADRDRHSKGQGPSD